MLFKKLLKTRKISILISSITLLLLIFGIPFIENKSENESYEEKLKNLESADEGIRLSAMSKLTSMGNKINPILLSEIEKNEAVLFKVSVIQILGNIQNASSINTFIKHLNHDNWRVRFFSAESLGKLNTSQAILPLENLIKSEKNNNVILVALLSLSKINEFNDIKFLKSLINGDYKFEDFIIKEIKKMTNNIELTLEVNK